MAVETNILPNLLRSEELPKLSDVDAKYWMNLLTGRSSLYSKKADELKTLLKNRELTRLSLGVPEVRQCTQKEDSQDAQIRKLFAVMNEIQRDIKTIQQDSAQRDKDLYTIAGKIEVLSAQIVTKKKRTTK